MRRWVLIALVVAGAGACAAFPAAADAPTTRLQMMRLSDRGPSFLAYDGAADYASQQRDWPVSLIFTGAASVSRVKDGLRAVGLTRAGHTQYLAYVTPGASPRFDSDRGLKSPCDKNGTDVHVRVYAPTATDRFVDPQFGPFVVATAHLDRADGCSTPPLLYGFSEVAERRVAHLLAGRLGWKVKIDALPLRNAEPYRRDVSDSGHVWWSSGRATVVEVPIAG
jgi:hypothetical protein